MRDGQGAQPKPLPHLHHCLDRPSNFETISGHRVDLASFRATASPPLQAAHPFLPRSGHPGARI